MDVLPYYQAMKKFNALYKSFPFIPFKFILALCTCAISGCAAFNYAEKDAPAALTEVPRLVTNPKIAVVLGSGGPRGYAHVGVLRF
jgi:hypothetical protein